MQKDNIITKLNKTLLKINRPTLVGIILVYAVILILIFIVLFPKQSFFVVPNYPHHTNYNDINLELRINPTRSVEDDGKIKTTYGITAALDALEKDNVTPKYKFENFQMSTLLESEKMYYFTEKNTGETPIAHHYSLDSTTAIQTPQDFFVRIKYLDQDEEEQTLTFKENMLDMGSKNRYSKYNIITDEEKHSGIDRKTQVRIDFYGSRVENDFVLRSQIEVVDISKPFHLDMQSWIISDSGEVYLATGVYGFSRRNYYVPPTPHLIDVKLRPEYIYSKVVYYEEGKEPQSILYKERLYDLPETQNDLPADPAPRARTGIDSNLVEYIIIIAVAGGIIAFAIKIVVDNRKKKVA